MTLHTIGQKLKNT